MPVIEICRLTNVLWLIAEHLRADVFSYGIVSARWKLVWWDCDQIGELYDLQNHPREMVNRFSEPSVEGIRRGTSGMA